MNKRMTAALLALMLLQAQGLAGTAQAENQMGYQLLPASQAAALSRGGGVLGLEVGRAQQITDSSMTFELLRVNGVRQNSAGSQAGLRTGDQIIAVDGHVFPSVAAFASYVGSGRPGQHLSIDYMPAGGGPQQAQRVDVALGGANAPAVASQSAPAPSTGLSTGTKVAIGVGAAALFGCYKLGCFSHHNRQPAVTP